MKQAIKAMIGNNVELLNHIDKMIYNIRTQNYDAALRIGNIVMMKLDSFLELYISNQDEFTVISEHISLDTFQNLLEGLLDAQSHQNYVLLADLYEIQFIPFLTRIQEILISDNEITFNKNIYEVNLARLKRSNPELALRIRTMPIPTPAPDAGYSVEFTSCGLKTVAVRREGYTYYLHSNHLVLREASLLAQKWYRYDKSRYLIYGLGFGYHIRQLSLLDPDIQIEVYESDLGLIQLACAYSDLDRLLSNEHIKLIYDPEFIQLGKQLKTIEDDSELVIHYPSLQVLSAGPIKEKLENYFIQYNAVKNQLPLLNSNFNRNIKYYDGFVDNLKEAFKGKDVYIIAAGPSLDKNFLHLKEVGDNGIILATGTVFKKLINAGIEPDYVLVTDPNSRVYKQISGYEDSDVPMLFLSTAYHGFAANYKGKKYMVCQKDFLKAEEYAGQKGVQLFRTGGSVSTTALDIGITLGCKRIIFLGLDLAYTDNYAHASDTSRRDAAMVQDMRQVEDIHGNMVATSRSLDIFRVWIENRIRDVKGIEFIDATEGGAKIKGMRIARLAEV